VVGLTEDCGCGKKGCIELKASGRNLQRISTELNCPVEEVFLRYPEEEKVQEFITMAACAIATEVTILDPVCTVLGGGVVRMSGFPLEILTERVKENLRVPDPRASFKLELSSGDPEAGVVGAVINAITLGH
jgi:allose kinase